MTKSESVYREYAGELVEAVAEPPEPAAPAGSTGLGTDWVELPVNLHIRKSAITAVWDVYEDYGAPYFIVVADGREYTIMGDSHMDKVALTAERERLLKALGICRAYGTDK